jgi:hypothetical protein
MMDIETLISGAAKGGWEWFDQVDPEIRKRVEVQKAKSEEDRRAIAGAWADFYKSPGGRKALEFLFDTTLRRTVFFVQLGLDPQSMATWGAFREGQNALAHEIARQIAAGLGEEGPKPRDT